MANNILEQALRFTLGEEGGYSDHPRDHGGATNFGITQKTLDTWNYNHPDLGFPEDVRNLTIAGACAIYRVDYWRWDELIDGRIQIKLFDIGVNFGPNKAVKILQEAVNSLFESKKIAVDGMLGPKTIGEANALNPAELMDAICNCQKAHYYAIVARDPGQGVFLNGWLKRASKKPVLA